MILCRPIKLCYINIPKTASMTVSSILKYRYECDEIRSNVGGLPKECVKDGWRFFTVVRHPIRRAISLWASTCLRDKKRDHYEFRKGVEESGRNPDILLDFLEWVLEADPVSVWLGPPQARRISEAFEVGVKCLEIVRIESLATGIASILGDPVEMPWLNPSVGREINSDSDPMDLITDAHREIISRWACEDYQIFPFYDPLGPPEPLLGPNIRVRLVANGNRTAKRRKCGCRKKTPTPPLDCRTEIFL